MPKVSRTFAWFSAGLVLGAIVGITAYADVPIFTTNRGINSAFWALLGAILGLALGAVVSYCKDTTKLGKIRVSRPAKILLRLLGLCAILGSLMLPLILLHWASQRVFDRIQIGMTESEAAAILESRYYFRDRGWARLGGAVGQGRAEYYLRDGPIEIEASFLDDKLVSKAIHGPTIAERMRHRCRELIQGLVIWSVAFCAPRWDWL